MAPFSYHVISALKNFLVVSTGAVIAYKIVYHVYDIWFGLYIFFGVGGFIVLSKFEEELRYGKYNDGRKED